MTTDWKMNEPPDSLSPHSLDDSLEIAVIGMSGRFPGAENLARFWENLRDGVESIRQFTDDELKSLGVSQASLRDPNFVKAGAILEKIDQFDASFFGYSPREAEIIDPQQRIFLECAWQALEDAGYSSDTDKNLVGVFAGTSLSTYLLYNLLANESASQDTFQAMIGNDKDFLSTRVSYELNLKGPSLDIQTACSTSLVAAHLACQSLLSYQCDIALAGGVSVQVPERTGYYYIPGGVSSPDGHCRAFDAEAQGTIFGSGVGVVVLKRLADAVSDRDTIHAVIKGSALSNDGSSKVGYTAPSIDGQARAISMAQIIAGVNAETISYIEAHGTGTALGDPAEIEALTKAFRASADKNNFCAIGSVKSNIGHLDAAAGVAGLIKTVLALKHRRLPPSLHFERPNPQIDFASSPFYINNRLQEWKGNGSKLRAGVSSFGVGGTNAHVILEEAPPCQAPHPSQPPHLILLSAKTESALDAMTTNLAEHLKQREDEDLADVAYTLSVGRKVFNYRRMIVCRGRDDLVAALESDDPGILTAYQEPGARQTVFMFPGGGAQYVNMAAGLYERRPVFREEIDRCSDLLKPQARYDLRDWLFPAASSIAEAAEQMRRTSVGLPALFVVELALARLWMSWGVEPEAMIGHSLGEYVAACLAGVFSLGDALSLVLLRSRLFERLPRGAMTSVPLSERELLSFKNDELSIAAVNAPSQCVVSGPVSAIDEMERSLAAREVDFRRLHIDVAAHSQMVEEILPEFAELLGTMDLHPPAIPFISNVSGTWITAAEATDPFYWAKHLRQTVRFADGIRDLLQDPDRLLLEVGPGRTLSSLVKMQAGDARRGAIFSSMSHPRDLQPDMEVLLAALGKLCLSNVRIDWRKFYAGGSRRRIPLPAYPFERQRYWIEPRKENRPVRSASLKKPDIREWIYLPLWKQSLPVAGGAFDQKTDPEYCSLFFADEFGLASKVAAGLSGKGYDTIIVRAGGQFSRSDNGAYTINPSLAGDYSSLLEDLTAQRKRVKRIVHAWSIAPESDVWSEAEVFDQRQERGFYSLLYLAQALADNSMGDAAQIDVLSNDAQEITGQEHLSPAQATLLSPCAVIPQEYPNIRCRSIDLTWTEISDLDHSTLLERLMAELTTGCSDTVVAYRGGRRWVQVFEELAPVEEPKSKSGLREGGVYLITGGLGGIGLVLAEYLARETRAKLILTGRSNFPGRNRWDDWLASHTDHDPISLKVKKLQAIERLGAEVWYAQADVADLDQMQSALATACEKFGEINGVIYAAGIAGEDAICDISRLNKDECERQFRPKVKGLFTLEKILRGKSLDFCLLVSSLSSFLGGIGHSAYSAANLFMDAFSRRRNQKSSSPWLCINWEVWRPAEQKEQTFSYKGNTSFGATVADLAISGVEGARVLEYVLNRNLTGQALVSTADLQARIDQWVKLEFLNQEDAIQVTHQRPSLRTTYVEPEGQIEQTVARVWQQVLGIERVGAQDNFFELGGNSLLGLNVVSRLKKELGTDVPVVALFEGPTVWALSRLLSRKGSEQPTYDKSRARGAQRREKRQKQSPR
jgi:acyl transferase domain-containing protein